MKIVLMILTLTLFACGKDSVTVNTHGDRISELERRADLNDQLDAARDILIELNSLAIASIQDDVIELRGDLTQAILNQSIVNGLVQLQLLMVNNRVTFLNNRLNILRDRVNSLESSLTDVQNEINTIQGELVILSSSLSSALGDISDLQDDVQSLSQQIDEEGVKVFKCNSAASTERIFKINGKFYAVMNRVTTKNIQVVTGSSSQTFTTPSMCQTFSGDLKLPNSGGQCTPNGGPFASTLIEGSAIIVPSYTTAIVTVVDSVKMAMEVLPVGNYATTDGAAACNFSITASGSTNLVQVQ
jgi:hypothetical protein